METTKTQSREEAYTLYNQNHFLLKCPYCGAELIVCHSELNVRMFEPHEEEYEYWVMGDEKHEKHIGKRMTSSDHSKDVFENIKCCKCGHIWDEPVSGMFDKKCQPDGEQVEVFELNETETKRAKEFIKKHRHAEELDKEHKIGFTALGHQFTYSITSGGFGSLVSIKCNYCGESEDITDIENW